LCQGVLSTKHSYPFVPYFGYKKPEFSHSEYKPSKSDCDKACVVKGTVDFKKFDKIKSAWFSPMKIVEHAVDCVDVPVESLGGCKFSFDGVSLQSDVWADTKSGLIRYKSDCNMGPIGTVKVQVSEPGHLITDPRSEHSAYYTDLLKDGGDYILGSLLITAKSLDSYISKLHTKTAERWTANDDT